MIVKASAPPAANTNGSQHLTLCKNYEIISPIVVRLMQERRNGSERTGLIRLLKYKVKRFLKNVKYDLKLKLNFL